MRLEVPAPLLEEIHEAAARAFPREACGVLAGRFAAGVAAVERVVELPNVASVPERSFVAEPVAVRDLIVGLRDEGLDALGTWHSHTHGSLIPSRPDLAGALDAEWVLLIVGDRRARAWSRGEDGTAVEWVLDAICASRYHPGP